MAKRIESRPTDGLSYNSTEATYWDRAGLDKEVERVFDICHGCRLCFNLCPSFPALFDAVDRNDGDERVLAHPDQLGKVGSLSPSLANMMCRQKFQRVVMEKLLGIHRDKLLPDFADETFDKWLERNPLPAIPAEPAAKVAIFPTCFVNYYNPAPGKAAVEVFAKKGCALKWPKQSCCGD